MRSSGSLPLSLALLLLAASPAPGQSKTGEPEIGYLYPAGARQGTVVRVLVGGQSLRDLKGVLVTGEGVRASVVRYMGRFVRLNGEERKALRKQIRELKESRKAGPPREEKDGASPGEEPAGNRPEGPEKKKEGEGKPEGKREIDPGLTNLTRHPLLSILEELTPEELEFVERKFLKDDPRSQPNAQIGETAMIEVAVDPGAPPGDRELRLLTGRGLSNPRCFQVGRLPEVREEAPADPRAGDTEAIELPVVLNGQITPGDADRFCLRAEKGQKLVIRAYARQLAPFLADAVPGWFQPTLTLRDGKGREIAFADDYRFDPDPILCFEIPETGIYKIEIQDSIWRGRDDFVYRLSVSEEPFIKSLFPLGGRSGGETVASVDGWNLKESSLPLDTRPGPDSIRFAALDQDGESSNLVAYAVDELPEIVETEPNDTPADAPRVELPLIVNGRISKPGDKDLFRFEGRAGDRFVAEVIARRLHSPLDSLLRLTDPSGRVLAWNDDYAHKQGYLHLEMGVITHHSDSYLGATLPGDGMYCVEVTDAQGQGGTDCAYRLRIGPPRPDFALYATPSSLTLQPGRPSVVWMHISRKDGFDGEIEVKLKGAPEGFDLQGGVIPPERGSIRMSLTAPNRRIGEPVRLILEGFARIGEREVRREVVPCEDMMQAFLWRHLVPSRELIAAVIGKGGRDRVELVGEQPVRIPLGGSARVRMKTPNLPNPGEILLELSEGPQGIALADVKILPRMVEFTLVADEKATAVGYADNVIVQAFTERTPEPAKGKKAAARRVSIGVLPAVPIRIVKKEDSGS